MAGVTKEAPESVSLAGVFETDRPAFAGVTADSRSSLPSLSAR